MSRFRIISFAVCLLFLISLIFVSCDIVPESALPHSNTVDPDYTDGSGDGGETVTEVPAKPAEPVVRAGGSGTLTVSWSAVAGATSYNLHYFTVNDFTGAFPVESSMDPDNTDTSAVITGLTDGTLYYIWLTASNSTGDSVESDSARSVPVASGTNHNGADLVITSTQDLGGTHYNVGTFSVASGVTLNVLHYDGSDSETGMLTIYAETINIEGTIDAIGAGYGGGGGGGGGAGGNYIGTTSSGGNSGSAVQGGSGGTDGSDSSNANGANGGSGGDGAGPGGGSGGSGGNGGSGGQDISGGSTPSVGSAGGNSTSGYYSASGSTSTNEIIAMGSGGGGGAGGGGGGGIDAANSSAFGGGGGGGSAGGNGGGMIKLYSFGNLSVSGILNTSGRPYGSSGTRSGNDRTGGTGGAATASSAGSGGSAHYAGTYSGTYNNPQDGGLGRPGGSGSGGGILLKGSNVNLSGGTLNCSGYSSNNGVSKIFYSGTLTDGTYSGDSDPDKNTY